MTFPCPPALDIDWANIEFRIWDVNGHVESTFDVGSGEWSQPQFVCNPHLQIHGLSTALNYGQQAFEGLKAFRDPAGNINIFRLQKHALRLIHSSSYVSIPAPSEDLFRKCVKLAVSQNTEFVPPHESSAMMYIRPLIFGSGAQLSLAPSKEFKFCVYAQPIPCYHGLDPLDAMILEDFDRAATKGTGSAKVGGNYAPVMRWSGEAYSQNFGITLHLDSKTNNEIEEFSSAGFLGLLKKGDRYTVVVPDSTNIVQSVTSDSCLALAKSFGWIVESRPILCSELSEFKEVLALGTAAAIVPIRSITRKSTQEKFTYIAAGDQPGECCLKLMSAYNSLLKGKSKDSFGWLERVQQSDKLTTSISMAAKTNGHV